MDYNISKTSFQKQVFLWNRKVMFTFSASHKNALGGILEAYKNMANSSLIKYLQSQLFLYLDIGIVYIHVRLISTFIIFCL